jgi:hypothetical protein
MGNWMVSGAQFSYSVFILQLDTDVTQLSPAKATCTTDIVYDDKYKKHAVTGFGCASTSRPATYTLFRSNPQEIINGKPSGASGIEGQYVTVGALFAGFFTLGMAIML